MVHAFNPILGRQRQTDYHEFEDSLVYKDCPKSRTARASQRNPVSIISKTKRSI